MLNSRAASVSFESQHPVVRIGRQLLVIDALLHALLYRTSLASRVIVVPPSACDTGQPALAASAYLANVAASRHRSLADEMTVRDPEATVLG